MREFAVSPRTGPRRCPFSIVCHCRNVKGSHLPGISQRHAAPGRVNVGPVTRDELPVLRYPGRAKSVDGLAGGSLYVSYSTNKEDVEYTRVPLPALAY